MIENVSLLFDQSFASLINRMRIDKIISMMSKALQVESLKMATKQAQKHRLTDLPLLKHP